VGPLEAGLRDQVEWLQTRRWQWRSSSRRSPALRSGGCCKKHGQARPIEGDKFGSLRSS